MSNNILLKFVFAMSILVLMFFDVACNASQNATSAISPTAETTTWTPLHILSPVKPSKGSVTLPGGIKVIPSVASPWPNVPVYEDVYKYAEIKTGSEFSIGLDADLILGISWTVNYDKGILSLVAQETTHYDQGQRLGTQWFRFKSISEGITALTFDLNPPHMNKDLPSIIRLPFTVNVIK